MISAFMVCEFNQSYGKTKCCLYDYFLLRSDRQTYCFVVIKNSCCWWPNHIDHIPILLDTECRQSADMILPSVLCQVMSSLAEYTCVMCFHCLPINEWPLYLIMSHATCKQFQIYLFHCKIFIVKDG